MGENKRIFDQPGSDSLDMSPLTAAEQADKTNIEVNGGVYLGRGSTHTGAPIKKSDDS